MVAKKNLFSMKLKWYEPMLQKVEEAMLCQWSNGRDIIYYQAKDTLKFWTDGHYGTTIFEIMKDEYVNKFDSFMENMKIKLLSQNTKLNFEIQILKRKCVLKLN